MRVVKLMYGLGNQLFEYAFYKKLKLLYGDEVYVDNEWYDVPGRNPWDVYQLDALGLFPNPISRKEYCVKQYYMGNNNITESEFEKKRETINVPIIDLVCEEPYGKDHRKIWLEDNSYYCGFFQNIDTIDIGISELKKELVFPNWEEREYREMKSQIMSDSNSVSIHVRMDNHVKEPECYDLINSDLYFENSIRIIRELVPSAHFYIFSNNMSKARVRLSELNNANFVDLSIKHYGIEDMELMSLCRHNIISNSTFSWWAAVLNKNHDKKVLIPDVFDIRLSDVKKEDINLYYSDWIRVNG